MKNKLIDLWKELEERRLLILKQRDESESSLGKQIYAVWANECAGFMDALNKIITEE